MSSFLFFSIVALLAWLVWPFLKAPCILFKWLIYQFFFEEAIDEFVLEKFIDEIKKISQVKHKNIVPIHGVCLESERPILVYRFIPGYDLSEFIKKYVQNSVTRSWNESRYILESIADAIHYLHSQDICHRNIKFGNILIDERDRENKQACLTDFGVMDIYDGNLDLARAKEQDVFGFGLVMAQVLAGTCVEGLISTSQFIRNFVIAIQNEDMNNAFDRRFLPYENMGEMRRFGIMARACLTKCRDENLTMEVVFNVLKGEIGIPVSCQIVHDY